MPRAEKGGDQSGDRSFARRAHHENPRPRRPPLPSGRVPPDRRPGGGLRRRRRAARPDARDRHPQWRQGLRQRCRPSQDREQRCCTEHSAQSQPPLEKLLLAHAARTQVGRHRDCSRPSADGPPRGGRWVLQGEGARASSRLVEHTPPNLGGSGCRADSSGYEEPGATSPCRARWRPSPWRPARRPDRKAGERCSRCRRANLRLTDQHPA